MGTWGAGNFDGDTAADHLGIVTSRLVADVTKAMSGPPLEIEPDEYWGVAVPCNLELLALIGEQRWVGFMIPEPKTIAEWKAKYLATWDRCIEDLEPADGHEKARRAVLVKTFDRIAKLSERRHGEAPAKPKPKTKKKK